MILAHGFKEYDVGKKVADSGMCQIYICKHEEEDCLLQIAPTVSKNINLDKAAYILRSLKDLSDLCDRLYTEKKIGYDLLFPILFDSFVSKEQGGRRINILKFKDIDLIEKLVPLSNLLEKNKVRISLETSGWIMGRFLKLLGLVHLHNISLSIDSCNVLIEPKTHRTILLDWSESNICQERLTEEDCKRDIAIAAKTIFTAIGGDIETGIYKYESNNVYVDFLWCLTDPIIGDAEIVHKQFYEIVDRIFGRMFYAFEVFPL